MIEGVNYAGGGISRNPGGLEMLVSGGRVDIQAAVHAFTWLCLANAGAACRRRLTGGEAEAEFVVIATGEGP